ncbi:hypothetical protein KR222_005045 [Zaprionus bogoriensis]|nr:hypothetical protein KR222_005045 [Zaprionus bogoriensis]
MLPSFSGNYTHQMRDRPRILVKCGGFSSQLARNVSEQVDGDPLWGSRFDETHPEAVVRTHLDFLHSGADIILTNTYQASVEGYMKHLGKTREQSVALIEQSVLLARRAKSQYLAELAAIDGDIGAGMPIILASIGPYGAHLHDGSEYKGSYANLVTHDELQHWHNTRIETCLRAGVDGLALETLPCQLEALAVTELVLSSYTAKFWVSFQCKDEAHLAHGEPFAEAALAVWRLVEKHGAQARLLGIGVNCVNPNHVTPLFRSLLARLPAGEPIPPLVVYSNHGEIYDNERGEWTGNALNVASFVPEWLELGARIVGGCCRVYPDDIREIRKCVDSIAQQSQSQIRTSST